MMIKTCLITFLTCVFLLSAHGYAEDNLEESAQASTNHMAVVAQGGGSLPTMGGGSFGAGLRFEYSVTKCLSVIVPLDYRLLAMGSFAENSKFDATTLGIGAKFYFSQIFWKQPVFRGFFVEAQVGLGVAKEYPGDIQGVSQPSNLGATVAIGGGLGYTHAFDFGLIIGGGVNIFGRGFTAAVKQKGVIAHPNPEILAQIGWAF